MDQWTCNANASDATDPRSYADKLDKTTTAWNRREEKEYDDTNERTNDVLNAAQSEDK